MEKALVLSGGGARGAFQVGVMKYLQEIGWDPDLICGTSIGAINAAAVGAGMDIAAMTRLWLTCGREKIFRLTPATLLRSLRSRRRFSPMSDTRPMRTLLKTEIDFDALKNSRREIIISALNVITGQIVYFSQRAITLDHLIAAGAIPGLFGWIEINGVPHWDAGLMANTPLAPAIKIGAREIIVVLHSPVGAFPVNEPRTFLDVAELVFEHFLIGSYACTIPDATWRASDPGGTHQIPLSNSPQVQLSANGAKILTVAPTRMLGFRSLLNFTPRQATALIDAGYNCARIQLKPHLKKS
jgi:NTE family protein